MLTAVSYTMLVIQPIWGIILSLGYFFVCKENQEGRTLVEAKIWDPHVRKYFKGDQEKSAWMYRLDLFTSCCANLREAGQLCNEVNK